MTNLVKFDSKYYIYSGKYNSSISGIVEVDVDKFELNIINYGFKEYFKRDYIRNRQ